MPASPDRGGRHAHIQPAVPIIMARASLKIARDGACRGQNLVEQAHRHRRLSAYAAIVEDEVRRT